MKKHYAVFYSPGTFYDESSSKQIEHFGDVETAVKMASDVIERHNARPYGFRFITCVELGPVVDPETGLEMRVESQRVAETGTYFINGRLRRYDEVVAENDPKEDILRSNMRQMPSVCETRNSFRHTAPFGEDDFVVNELGGIVARGNDPELVEYRRSVLERIAKEIEKK